MTAKLNPMSGFAGRLLSRRQMLRASAGVLLAAPAVSNGSVLQHAESCIVMLGPFGRDKVPGFIGAKKDTFIEPQWIRFFAAARFAEERTFRIGVGFDFRGYEATLPLRRRVRLEMTLLDDNRSPLVSVGGEFLDRRAVARESLKDPLTCRRGGLASTLGASYDFEKKFLDVLQLVELRFTELEPAERLAAAPFA